MGAAEPMTAEQGARIEAKLDALLELLSRRRRRTPKTPTEAGEELPPEIMAELSRRMKR